MGRNKHIKFSKARYGGGENRNIVNNDNLVTAVSGSETLKEMNVIYEIIRSERRKKKAIEGMKGQNSEATKSVAKLAVKPSERPISKVTID